MTMKTNNTETNATSIFANLTADDLRDDARLLDWFRAATQRKNPVVRDHDTDRLNTFAAAERALEVGKNPAALFASIVGGHRWDLISCAQEDRGRQRLRRLQHQQFAAVKRSGPIRTGGKLAEVLKTLSITNMTPKKSTAANL